MGRRSTGRGGSTLVTGRETPQGGVVGRFAGLSSPEGLVVDSAESRDLRMVFRPLGLSRILSSPF